jgi:hypothetical protein
MNRRNFLSATVTGITVYIVSRLPWHPHGAVFKVTWVDPECSGADYSGHLGHYVYNAKRCCRNCTMVFAAWAPGGDVENGPGFGHRELTPVNGPAKRIARVVALRNRSMSRGSQDFALTT